MAKATDLDRRLWPPIGLDARSSYSAHKAAKFLRRIAEGESSRQAAIAVGTSLYALHRWKATVPGFAQAWAEVVAGPQTEALASAAHERAMDGSDAMTSMLLKARAPDQFRERKSVEVTVTPLTGDELAAARALGANPELLPALETVAAAIAAHRGDQKQIGPGD
jgi:hypothetical protein